MYFYVELNFKNCNTFILIYYKQHAIQLKTVLLTSLLLLLTLQHTYSQEWKNMHTYKKETGNANLQNGCWLKKDRKRNTETWKQANYYNLSVDKGNEKYKNIRQIRDFYIFYNEFRMQQGHDIKWMGIASVAANQLAKMENCFLRLFVVRNKELVDFAHQGSTKVFAFSFPQLQQIYTSKQIITGDDALIWDKKYGTIEQCEILQPLYDQLSDKAIKKLERMAKGKGIFRFGVAKKLRFEGNINDCDDRYEHGKSKLIPYCNIHNH